MLKLLKSQGDSSNTKHGETEGTVKNRIIGQFRILTVGLGSNMKWRLMRAN